MALFLSVHCLLSRWLSMFAAPWWFFCCCCVFFVFTSSFSTKYIEILGLVPVFEWVDQFLRQKGRPPHDFFFSWFCFDILSSSTWFEQEAVGANILSAFCPSVSLFLKHQFSWYMSPHLQDNMKMAELLLLQIPPCRRGPSAVPLT